MATTLRDIATQLDVSVTVVSRVLNRKPGTWASPALSQRIFETAQYLEYRPSAAARALVTGRTRQIAVSSSSFEPHARNAGAMLGVRGLIEVAEERSYRLIVLPTPNARAEWGELRDVVETRSCDGVCLGIEEVTPELCDFLLAAKTPFVIVGDPGRDDLPRVDHDNFNYAADSVRALHGRGCTRIAWATLEGEANFPHAQKLRAGYRHAMRELGLTDETLLEPPNATNAPDVNWLRGVRADGLITRYLGATLPWVKAFKEAGVNIPNDIQVLAELDPSGSEFLDFCGLGAGVIRHLHDPHRVGREAAHLLFNWIEGEAPTIPGLLRPPLPADQNSDL